MALPRPVELPDQPFEISLSVRHPTIDPAEISRALGLEPIEAFGAGHPRALSPHETEARAHPETYWVAVFGPQSWIQGSGLQFWPDVTGYSRLPGPRGIGPGTLEVRLAMVCEHLRARHCEFLQRLTTEGGRIALRVTLSPLEVTSFTLPQAAARVLTELGITIGFDFSGS